MTSIAPNAPAECIPTYPDLRREWERAMATWGSAGLRVAHHREQLALTTDRLRAREAAIRLGMVVVEGYPIDGKSADVRDAQLRVAVTQDASCAKWASDLAELRRALDDQETMADQARYHARWCEATLPLLAKEPPANDAPPITHIPHDVPTENCPTCDGAGWLRFTTADHRPLGRMRCQDGCDDGQVVAKAPTVPPSIDGGMAGGGTEPEHDWISGRSQMPEGTRDVSND